MIPDRHIAVFAAALLLLGASGAAAAAQVTITTSGGDVVTVNQKNLVDHMIVGDSLEIATAGLAAVKATNPAVRSFATMLVNDHRADLDNLYKLAAKGDIGREPNAADTSALMGVRMLERLRNMPSGQEFDRMFLRREIRDHLNDIRMLQQLRPAAKDDEVRHEIDHAMPVLERHLARARELAAQLGVNADSARDWRQHHSP